METKNIIKFIFELGQQRRVSHEGWKLLGIRHPDNVAEHSLRAAQIGFALAVMEGYEKPEEVCAMLVFHDMAECRVGDLHKVAARYVKADELRAAQDQTSELGEFGEKILDLWKQVEEKSTLAGRIAKDADYLETAVSGKEYLEQGHTFAQDWITNVSNALKTDSAKRLIAELQQADSNEWWQGLKKLS
ncbi:HD domain-containing protein [Candidatus Uhrbacteria bacterium]|nr:HD domain-containing protein [Candidatus Uhrbacteria bacterium]